MDASDNIALISKLRTANNRFIEQQLRHYGVEDIATSHGDILYALFGKKSLTMAQIAQKIGKDKSTVTALINKLLQKGYLTKERDTLDSRVVYVKLTNLGESLEPMFMDISRQLLSRFYDGISDEEAIKLYSTLNKAYRNMLEE